MELEIAAIMYLLDSFADFEDDEPNRKKHLKENFGMPFLKTYYKFTEAELKVALGIEKAALAALELEKEKQKTG